MGRDLGRIVNDQVSLWRLQRQGGEPGPRAERAPGPHVPAHVVAIANQMGANGRHIGERVGKLLGLPTYDREIMQHIADTAHVSVTTVETLDEHARNRLEDYITSLLREQTFDASDHLRTLSRIVVALWEHGPCVLTGHGSVHLVPREYALCVRLVAPQEIRIERVAASGRFPPQEAKRRVQASDAEREAFHRRYFNANIHDPLLFDLVLNSGYLDDGSCAEVIARAYRARFDRPASHAAPVVRG